MTTEHVSVPRELPIVASGNGVERYIGLADGSFGVTVRNASDWREQALFRLAGAILSRATPSNEHHEPSWQLGYTSGYNDGVQDGKRTGKAKPSAPRVVTSELSNTIAGDIAEHLRDKGWSSGGDYQDDFLPDVEIATRAALESFATSLPAARVPDGEVRLWDTQWMTIVNHDNCYRDWSKDDAVAHAVKMTEQAIARNVADGKLPPKKTAAAPHAGERCE